MLLPHGVVCLLSALQVHELTTEVPHAVWIMIDRHARMPKVSYPQLEVVRASGPARDHGVEHRKIEGVPVRMPSAIVPDEMNWLVNPHHPDIAKIKATVLGPFSFDGLRR